MAAGGTRSRSGLDLIKTVFTVLVVWLGAGLPELGSAATPAAAAPAASPTFDLKPVLAFAGDQLKQVIKVCCAQYGEFQAVVTRRRQQLAAPADAGYSSHQPAHASVGNQRLPPAGRPVPGAQHHKGRQLVQGGIYRLGVGCAAPPCMPKRLWARLCSCHGPPLNSNASPAAALHTATPGNLFSTRCLRALPRPGRLWRRLPVEDARAHGEHRMGQGCRCCAARP